MRQLIVLLVFLLVQPQGYAQKVNEDSLKNVIATATVDSSKVNAMLVYANYLIRHKMEDSNGVRLLEEAKQISEKNHFYKDITRYYLMMGNYRQQKSDWAGAMENFHKMIAAASNVADKNARLDAIMKANNNLAGIYVYNGDFAGSLEFYLKALEQVENLPHNANSKATLYVNIASAYRELNLANKEFEYLQKITPLLPEIKDALKIAFYYELYQNQLLKNQNTEAAASL
jgi:two-component system, NarL family, sensor kinase